MKLRFFGPASGPSSLHQKFRDSKVNPKGGCKAITLRSGKVLEDNSEPKLDKQDEDKIVEDSSVKSATEESVQA
ncbi:hypothetical protein PIB30_084265 [Stylosanthes scabra]|uniref:Uncharacterized protein n=1 Tax=Stylosanthes scabra TaxID=79078 RepID=A0ABU6QSM2_9FABA|nr:hypothetical protein [Stylosanthes scabra]